MNCPSCGHTSSTDGTPHAMGCGASGGQASVAVAVRDTSPTITSNYGKQVDSSDTALGPNIVFAAFKYTMGSKAHGIGYAEEQSPTLDTRPESNAVFSSAMQVRRLTPIECERLQGFPDNYTAIPWRGKPASECPDGPRYKALGNSWAVPVVRWIGARIQLEAMK